MHELVVCRSLIDEVARVARSHDARCVRKIVVAVGPLSGVEAKLLEHAFLIAKVGTVAAEATLEVAVPPVKIWCETCGRETTVAVNALLCGDCGGWQVSLRSGDELILKSVELSGVRAPIDEMDGAV